MKKKSFVRKGLFLFLTLLLSFSARAQVVFSEWIATTGTPGWDIVNDMTIDASKNIYITGSYTDTTGKSKSPELNTHTVRIMYLAKFDTAGKMIWIKNIGSGVSGYGGLIARGQDNQIILAGGDAMPGSKSGSKSGLQGFFLSSLDTAGRVKWSNHFSGTKFDFLTSMVADTLGDEILVSGYFHDTLHVENSILRSAGKTDGVLLRFDFKGKLINSRIIGGMGEDCITASTIDYLGNCLVAGSFQRRIRCGENTALEVMQPQEHGLFLAKYNHTGDFLSAIHFASGKKVRIHSVTSFRDQIFIAGSFSGIMTIGNQVFHSLGGDDVFLVCFDKGMKVVWTKQIGGEKKDRPSRMFISQGQIILSGSFSASMTIDQQRFQPTGMGSDLFILALDFSGKLYWMRSAGGEANDYPASMVSGNDNEIYLTGSFRKNFDLNGLKLQSVGEEDVFIVRLENCKRLAPKLKTPVYRCEGKQVHLDAGAGFVSYDWSNGLGHEQKFTVEQEGIYPVELISANGCVNFDTVIVFDVQSPVAELGNDTTIADTSCIILNAGNSNSQYLWNNGATTAVNVIRGIDLDVGDNLITVLVTNGKGCSSDDNMIITIKRTIPEQFSELISGSCTLFPNPTQDIISVSFNLSFESLELILRDPMGKDLMTRHYPGYLKNSLVVLNLGSFPGGLYTLHIKTEQGATIKKIVLQ